MMAGAPAPQSLLIRLKKFLPNGEIHTPYGATEALPVTTISASEIFEKQVGLFNHGRKGICVGRAFPSVGIKVIQVVNEAIETIEVIQECAVGEVGEIIVTGPSVTKFYDGLKEATAISKIHDGKNVWHRMGDVGWIDADGFLWFCGRKVERVVAGNKIFETVCCESVFNQMEFVARSALVAIDNKPCIVIEPIKEAFPKDNATKRALKKLLRQQALSDPNTELIKDFYFEQSFPVDVRHNAKIHRLSLAKKLSISQ
jgi:acyl-CoA synthetase (AMP-forming)/AMP-acid ligase II